MYLVCIRNGEQILTEIDTRQQRKLSYLIQQKKLPKTIKIGDSVISREEVLGFTDKRPAPKQANLNIKNLDDLGTWVKSQPWYKSSRPSDSTRNE